MTRTRGAHLALLLYTDGERRWHIVPHVMSAPVRR